MSPKEASSLPNSANELARSTDLHSSNGRSCSSYHSPLSFFLRFAILLSLMAAACEAVKLFVHEVTTLTFVHLLSIGTPFCKHALVPFTLQACTGKISRHKQGQQKPGRTSSCSCCSALKHMHMSRRVTKLRSVPQINLVQLKAKIISPSSLLQRF